MAMLRLLYRRFNLIGAILLLTSVWVLYLIISAPAASDRRYVNSVMPYVDMDQFVRPSVTRKVTAGRVDDKDYLDKVIDKIHFQGEIIPPPPKDEHGAVNVNYEKPAIPKPPEVQLGDKIDNVVKDKLDDIVKGVEDVKKALERKEDRKEEKGDSPGKVDEGKHIAAVEDKKEVLKNDTKLVKENIKNGAGNLTKADKPAEIRNGTKGPVLKEMEKKVYELGEKVKNKTMGEWETVKNKTIEKLTDLGVIQKPKYVKLIYRPVKWNLNISLETIGFIMKDTEFLLKKQNLTEMEYQPLMAPNSTLRINLANSSYGLGFCDCSEFSCVCCVRMFNKWMHLNSTACSKITFESKSQELNFEYSVDKVPVLSEKIAAEFPPKICMESTSKAVGACVLFSNVTSKVAIDNEDHKLHLTGCMEFDLTLYNKTVSAFPVACFQIPNTHVTHEPNKAPNLGNFMP